jgi:uncharacterized protein (TIGR03000 family)
VNAGSGETYDTVTTLEDQSYAFSATDFGITSGDGTTGVQITTLPTGGTLADNGTPVTVGQNIPLSDLAGGLVYTPADYRFGPGYDNFDFAPYTGSGPGSDPEMVINVDQVDFPATIQMTLPIAGATVLIDGQSTTSTGTQRTYETPALSGAGTYTVRVTYEVGGFTMVDQRQVEVEPGETTPVDFTQPGPNVSTSAQIKLVLPNAGATVTFDGASTTSTGTTRLYSTPPLEAGNYSYTVVVRWADPAGQSHTEEREVVVGPGAMIAVNFNARISAYPGGSPPGGSVFPFLQLYSITPNINPQGGGGRYGVVPQGWMWFHVPGTDQVYVAPYYAAGTTGPFYTVRWSEAGAAIITPIGPNPARASGQPPRPGPLGRIEQLLLGW